MLSIILLVAGLLGNGYQANCYYKYNKFINERHDDERHIRLEEGTLKDNKNVSDSGTIIDKVELYEGNEESHTYFVWVGRTMIPMTTTDMEYKFATSTISKVLDYKSGKLYLPLHSNSSSFFLNEHELSFDNDCTYVGTNSTVEEFENCDIGPYLEKYKIDYSFPRHRIQRYKFVHYQLYNRQHVMAVFNKNRNITMIGTPNLVRSEIRRLYGVRPWITIGSLGLIGVSYAIWQE